MREGREGGAHSGSMVDGLPGIVVFQPGDEGAWVRTSISLLPSLRHVLCCINCALVLNRALVGLALDIWDPLAFYSSLFTALLFAYYLIKIFILRTSAPALSLPTFSASSDAPRRRSWNWSLPWKRRQGVALPDEEEPLFNGLSGATVDGNPWSVSSHGYGHRSRTDYAVVSHCRVYGPFVNFQD